jgi:hypothetical protein
MVETKNGITKVEMNGEELSTDYKKYISKMKDENNVLKVTLRVRFERDDEICLSLDSGYSWINISKVFKIGDKCSKFKLKQLSRD